jgi:hypothetical protein
MHRKQIFRDATFQKKKTNFLLKTFFSIYFELFHFKNSIIIFTIFRIDVEIPENTII